MPDTITLDATSESVRFLCCRDKRLAKAISMIGSITYTPYDDSYSFLVSQIIGQMLSNKVAQTIFNRLIESCDGRVMPHKISLLTDEQIKSIGTSKAKVKYIQCLTEAVLSGEIIFSELTNMSDNEVMRKLTSLHGIGNWSAKMYLIFVLNRQDILPYEDVAFLQGYSWLYKTTEFSTTILQKKCSKWKPYSSIATRFLYRALDTGLTKNEFHLYK